MELDKTFFESFEHSMYNHNEDLLPTIRPADGSNGNKRLLMTTKNSIIQQDSGSQMRHLFVKRHANSFTTKPILFYLVCFFRQVFRSVSRPDYLTMRHGFVSVHLAPGSRFNFRTYIKRSLEDDYKVVVGISPILWAFSVIFLLLNVYGWHAMLRLSIMPVVVILAVGTKLQAIMTRMAVEITERHAVIQGIPLVEVSDRHFWFSWPRLVLHLIHFSLFLNAFEITYFVWISYEFGLHSCFHGNTIISITRVVIGLLVQVLCSYIILPLYALITQMGSTMKKSIFDDQTSKALKKWRKNAKKNAGKPRATATRRLGSPDEAPENSPREFSYPNTTDQCTATIDGQSSYQLRAVKISVDIPADANEGCSSSEPKTRMTFLTGS